MVNCQAENRLGNGLISLSVAVDWRLHQECGIMDHNQIEPAPIGRAGVDRATALGIPDGTDRSDFVADWPGDCLETKPPRAAGSLMASTGGLVGEFGFK
jgi:hypothetical protein